jgi:nitrite reductase/ring-hydroxylating ferredoxin subunit
MEDRFRAARPYCGETVELFLVSYVDGARFAATSGRSKSEPKEAIRRVSVRRTNGSLR